MSREFTIQSPGESEADRFENYSLSFFNWPVDDALFVVNSSQRTTPIMDLNPQVSLKTTRIIPNASIPSYGQGLTSATWS